MPLMDYFDCCYVINLPERRDRRREMEKELERAGMPPESGRVEFFPAIRPESAGPFPSIGAHGCFMSHLGILREARGQGLRNVLILEDDLTFAAQFPAVEEKLLGELRETRWDFAFFGHVLELPEAGLDSAHLEPYAGPIVTAHFYAVNGPVIERLLAFLDTLLQRPPGHPDGGPMHVDGAYSTFRQQNPDVVTLVAVPSLGWQRSSRSDIYPNRWYDRWPLVRDLVALARRGKVWLRGNHRV
ncbi:glycosyltransferase family 25 protein [Methylococcus sp. ANG]|uniref:glycosyltransferase family 25 protein n=1 Tax=Methylococcus sp. ANG TaxID=3231903 RepID=UPI00345AF310